MCSPSIQPTTHVKSESAQVEIQASTTSYQSIDMPGDSMSDMSGMLDMNSDMNSLMGLYSGGNNDDFGDDWGEVTKDDFSFFDEVSLIVFVL